MEENSESHMDTGVSSTTDDILEVQEVTGSHSNVETVVVIEIDDERASPDANKAVLLAKSPSKIEPPKPTKPPPQELTVKKIIIKRDRKDFQIKSVQKSPSKSEDVLKSPGKDSSPNKLVQSSITHKPDIYVVETLSKVENIKSPTKETQKLIQSPSCNSSEPQKGSPMSPVKDSQVREKTSVREPIVVSPSKISITSPNEDHQSPNKEKSSKGISTNEPTKVLKEQSPKVQPPKAPTPKEQSPKEQLPKAQTPKEQSPKIQPLKAQTPTEQSPKVQPLKAQTPKEQSPKVHPPKVQTPKEQSPKEQPTKEQQAKQSVKEQESKTSPSKEHSEGPTSTKDLTCKIGTFKETPTETLVKESLTKTPGKESPIKPVEGKEKDIPAKVSVIKETISKLSAKEISPPAPTEPEKKLEDNSNSKADEVPIKNKNLSLLDDKEASNDSQMETCSETSEKEHKSISRELKSLINSAKESKIISECTQLTSKTRKSRTLDSANTSLNISADAEKLHGVRRSSDNSQKSSCSEKSDKAAVKRSMRSQNPEFVTKVKNFLNSVSGKSLKNDGEGSDDEVEEKPKEDKESTPVPKKKKIEEPAPRPIVIEKGNKLRIDPYCWRCHWATEPAENEKNPHPPVHCSVCPRSFHFKCLSGTERNKINPEKNWVCPECMLILQAESSETRSPAMKKISLGMLCDLLKYALERMTQLNGVEPFMQPVDRTTFHDYDKYVVHPMDLGLMKQHITDGHYGSTEAFLADVQWILHNSIIFNTLQSKLTAVARALVRSCRVEMSEIEACPECYSAAHARKPTWFTDVCSTPHILLWAKLKGFPYWPAKGMSVNSSGHVDVRFFGAHDRAWVPARDCFLYSEKDPNNFRTKRQDILDSMQEAEQHIRNITRKYGKFVYPPFKTQFDPTKMNEQLKFMIPSFEGDVKNLVKEKSTSSPPAMLKDKSRSNSKSSKESFNDGYTSEGEEAVPSRKMADGAVIAREEEDYSIDKEKEPKPMEVDPLKIKEKESSRKRRRSDLEEAVITIIDTSREKRKRVENADKKDKETKDKVATPKAKENQPSTSTERSGSPKVAPIKLISISKVMKNSKFAAMTIVKDEDKDKTPDQQKTKVKSEKSSDKSEKSDKEKNKDKEKDKEKDKDTTTEESKDRKSKRRSSKHRSSTHSDSSKSEKTSKKSDKTDKSSDTPGKEKSKDHSSKNVPAEIQSPGCSSTENTKSAKDRIQFDDDTSLAVLARESRSSAGHSGLPTISCVRSLSSASSSASVKSTEGAVEASSDSSIFTPTSSDKVKNMTEAANKLQKLRSDTEPQVGRIGVRAFARTASPENDKRPSNAVEVEIKTEPMDFDDADRHMEKMDLMNAFKLRPVNPSSNLREVRINKVVVTPNQVVNRKSGPTQTAPTQPPTIRPRAKKTFPQPKKPEENTTRSELTSKNSMVYIPIQPPMTQAPVRGARPMSIAQSTPPTSKGHSASSATNNSLVNTVTSPLMPVSLSSFSSPISSTSTNTSSTSGQGPTVGQVPTTVHTMPLITSVNGQWTFSLQPVLSVGGNDSAPSPPMVNGISERAILPLAGSTSVLVPAAAPIQAVPTSVAGTAPNRGSSDTSAPGEPPRLQQRPALMNPLDASAPVGSVPPPSTVGPLTAKLNQNAVKMTDFFRQLLEDSIERLEEPLAQVTALKLQLEQYKWRHQQEIDEIKHNHELTLTEMRSSFEKEKIRLVTETRRQTQVELDAAVKLAKSKQWCANCSQEAQFYCCWNTSYCDYPCQRAHWTQHYAVCTQQRTNDSNNDSSNSGENRLQSPPENLPKTTAAPNLTVGGKQLAPSRVYTQEQQHQQKASIIVSMVDEGTGNPTMKCVGTYKQPASAQMSPLIINKQIMSNEEAAKKVVTSGGYLIVGATNSPNATTIPQARRTHAIQYIS